MKEFLLGVDEAGRGPLAGPVSVGVVSVERGFDVRVAFPEAADSKVLSEKRREAIYESMAQCQKEGLLQYRVLFASAEIIDTVGISKAVRDSVWNGVRMLAPDTTSAHVLLDGSLSAPPEYSQETIIRGDASEPIISLASIVAKVERDRLMKMLAKEYPLYGFEIHKGYGTKKHMDALRTHGLSVIHRRSFCGSILSSQTGV